MGCCVFQELEKFFYAKGEGLPQEKIESEDYKV